MLLLPSTIHCLQWELAPSTSSSPSSILSSSIPPESTSAEDVSKLPKMQVFCKDSCYYALDANVLQMYQNLEERGLCDLIKVDVVTKKMIPASLWKIAACPNPTSMHEDDEHDSDVGYIYDSDQFSYSAEENNSDSDDGLMECPVCHVHLPSITHLTQHQLSKRHFACSSCGMVFSTLAAVQNHEDSVGHCKDIEDDT